jgi:hypothetical protein
MEEKWIGAWELSVTAYTQNITFPGLLTLTSDGIVFAEEVPDTQETTGHGSWKSNGADEAVYTFVVLLGSSELGKWSKFTAHGKLVYDAKADTMSGPFDLVIVDQDGKQIQTETGDVKGTRIAAW